MKRTHRIAALLVIGIIAVLIVVGLVSGIGFSLDQIQRTFGVLEPQVGIVLAVACLTVFLAAWLVASAIRSSKQREIDARLAHDRSQIYEAVLEVVHAGDHGSPSDRRLPDRDAAMRLRAGVDVLREYTDWLVIQSGEPSDPEKLAAKKHSLLVAMRRDLGVDTFGVEPTREDRPFRGPVVASPISAGDSVFRRRD